MRLLLQISDMIIGKKFNLFNYELSKANILKKVSQREIFEKLFNIHPLQRSFKIKSLIRKKDPNPSMQITIDKDNNLLWYDHGLGVGGDVFDLVGQYYEVKNFKEILSLINSELNLELSSASYTTPKEIEPTYSIPIRVDKAKINKHIYLDRKTFSPQERNWWADYGIDISTLKRFKVTSCRRAYIGFNKKVSSTPDSPVYAYEQQSHIGGNPVYRIYRPFEKKGSKFLGNATIHDVQGIEQIPEKGKLLVITKSLKDVMVLSTYAIPAVAPHSETSGISAQYLNQFFMDFHRIMLLFDDDDAGREGAKRICEIANYNIPKIWVPKQLKSKDISDMRKDYGKRTTSNFIQNTLGKYIWTKEST